jgi:hypothetical protein
MVSLLSPATSPSFTLAISFNRLFIHHCRQFRKSRFELFAVFPPDFNILRRRLFFLRRVRGAFPYYREVCSRKNRFTRHRRQGR